MLLSILLVAFSSACDDDPPPRYPAPPPPGAVATEDDTTVDDSDPSAIVVFHDPLDPYGTWVDDPTYGTVWVPSDTVVGDDFTPYVTAGHWVYDDDWIWVSDYEWGWAPFHYGRWVWIDGHKWCWIPGRRYAGAWVVWRGGDASFGYVGWAPAPPAFVWRGGVAVRTATIAPEGFVFVGREEVFSPALRERVIFGERAHALVGASVVVGGVGVRGPGPDRLGIPPRAVVRGYVRPHYVHGAPRGGHPGYRGGHGGGGRR